MEALSSIFEVSTTALEGIIATISSFAAPTTTATSTAVQATGNVGYNGSVFLGDTSRARRNTKVFTVGVMLLSISMAM